MYLFSHFEAHHAAVGRSQLNRLKYSHSTPSVGFVGSTTKVVVPIHVLPRRLNS